jgi:ribonucleoside-diphosphate reductase alpha chain
MKIPTRAVPQALERLGYNGEAQFVLDTIAATGELPKDMKASHKRVFQTAIGEDQISTEGHLLMMAAVQPFLSGGISKTVNMAATSTVGDVANVYMRAWELGLKCVAIYRDGCKASQPASAKAEKKEETKPIGLQWGQRKRLADERMSVTHKFSIGGQDGYVHAGLNPDGTPGEIFLSISKAGSTLHGLVDMAATAMSLALQHGAPLTTLLDKLKGVRFEPSGFTGNQAIPRADSIADYLAKWLEIRFLQNAQVDKPKDAPQMGSSMHGDPCRNCGNLTVRAGSCWCCLTCGSTTGCG